MECMQQMRRAGNRPQGRVGEVLRLAGPAIVENLLVTLVQYVDTAMVGSLGAVATAAVAVNASPMWLLSGIMTSVGVGGMALAARFYGAGDYDGAERVCGQMAACAAVLSALCMAVVCLISNRLPVWMGAEAEVAPLASDYLRIVALGFIPNYMGVVLANALRAAGNMRTPMLLTGLANVLNVIGNTLLIFPSRTVRMLGLVFPVWGAGLGVQGAAIATALSTATSGVLMILALVLGRRTRIRLRGKYLRPQIKLLMRMLGVGIPAALERIAINVGQILFARIVASFGTAQLAAHHLAITVESLGYMPAFGIQAAATALVGQSLGAKRPDDAETYGRICNRMGIVCMCLASALMVVFARPLMAIFTRDEQVQRIGAWLLCFCAAEEPFFGVAIVMSGALRGAGDTRVPFYISLCTMWCVRLVVAYVFGTLLGLGIYGAWAGMVADLAVRGVWLYVRFARGRWKEITV